MATQDEQILKGIMEEASQARSDNAQTKSGLKNDNDPDEQENIENKDVLDEDSEEELDNESEEESDEETESDEEESEIEDESDEKNEHIQRRLKAKERAESRKEKELEIKDQQIQALTAELQKFKDADTEKQKLAIGERIKEKATQIATARNLDPEGLTEIMQAAYDMVYEGVESQVKSLLPRSETIQSFEEQQEYKKDEVAFNDEWENPSFQEYLENKYPTATARQLSEAKKILFGIAHSEDGGTVYKDSAGKERVHPYPLKYLMQEFETEFTPILNIKKKAGLETAGVRGLHEGSASIDKSTAKGMDALDKQYRETESETTSLRQERSTVRSI